ncbi:MAG: glycosyltransferase family 2 protein [Candidatus Coatesbacteria bacterium]|nr:MAG: glycosyltransferase family 2 protein [Candidatus Coatesbacteria bacterium]
MVRAEGTELSAEEYPLVSVVVPCRNEEAFIERALASIRDNEWPRYRLEIIVVDGMSTDRTREVVAALAAEDPRVRLLDNPERFAGAAMRVGVAAARGDYIVRVDAHAEIPPDYLKTGLRLLRERPEVWAVGGPVDRLPAGKPARLVAALNSNVFATGNTPVRVGRAAGPVDAVLYPVWPRWVFERVGEFDETLVRNQDDDFHFRLRRAGGVIYQLQEMRARYYVRGSVAKFLRQYRQYAFWKIVVAKKHGRLLDWKPLVPLLFFGSLVLTAAGGLITPYAWYGTAALASAYGLADAVASAAVARKTRVLDFFKALAVFPLFHLNYACGMVAGFWASYVRRWTPRDIIERGIHSRLTR